MAEVYYKMCNYMTAKLKRFVGNTDIKIPQHIHTLIKLNVLTKFVKISPAFIYMSLFTVLISYSRNCITTNGANVDKP